MTNLPEKGIKNLPTLFPDGDLPIAARDRVLFTWHGCAHHRIQHQGKRIVIDPLYHRPAGATPPLSVSRRDVDRIDCLLLTHAHLDHSWDFPYLASSK